VGILAAGRIETSKQVMEFRPNLPARHPADISARHQENVPCYLRSPQAVALAGDPANAAPRHGRTGLAAQRDDQSTVGACLC